MKNEKRGQAWGFDVIIGLIIFTLGILIFYLYSINISPQAEQSHEVLSFYSDSIADSLVSEGNPINWSSSDVITPGILTQGKINETKLEILYDFSSSDYSRLKSVLHSPYNFFINFSEPVSIHSNPINTIGLVPEDPQNLIKTSRLVIYNNKPVTLSVFTWN